MTEPATWTVRPLSVHIPPRERRNPIAMVRLAVGPLEMTLAVSRLKKSDLVVRPPMAEGGVPAISAAPSFRGPKHATTRLTQGAAGRQLAPSITHAPFRSISMSERSPSPPIAHAGRPALNSWWAGRHRLHMPAGGQALPDRRR